MKKNLRLLCLGLAAATITCGFAQEDKTSLLKNADMEQGLRGWAVDGTDVVGKNTKVATVKIGFHGMSQGVQESWHSNYANPLGASYAMQRLSNLPSGTYVFGAYVAAAKQHNRNDICERVTKDEREEHVLIENAKGEKVHQYSDWWSNRDSIFGVELFANEATVPVATDNPDLSERSVLWGHSSKFNVAVTLTDNDVKKGVLNVGLRVTEETNVNYVVWDNATLYYFGNMSEADALDAMAKIDMTKAAEIADTLKSYKMNVDSLANLEAAINAAAAKTSTAATLWDDSEAIHIAAGLARRSITDYSNLKKNIESAKVVLGGEWSEYAIENDVPFLEEQLAAAEAAYKAAELGRGDLTELRTKLNWAAGAVKLDSLYTAQEYLDEYAYEAYEMLNKPGGCSQDQLDALNRLAETLTDTLGVYEAELELEFDERKCNPNNLYPFIARVYATIEDVQNNPYDADAVWSMTLPQSETAIAGYKPLAGTTAANDLYTFESDLIEFDAPVELLRMTVTKVSSNQIYFCLQSLEFFDADGVEIPLTAANFYSNADHNTVAGFADGQSYEGLVDDKADTYFHSDWSGKITEPHYIEVTLPNGGYSAVSFKMVARNKDQRHQFPGEIVLSTPELKPNLAALEALLLEAKAKDAYSSKTEVGFYTVDFSFLINKIAEIEAALEGDPSDEECEAMRLDLQRQLNAFNKEEDKSVHLPDTSKVYHIVSGYPGFYEKQFVEKALTVRTIGNASSLWWSNASADSLQQMFEFEPIMEEGEHVVKMDGETALYAYTIKSVATKLYVDSAFVGDPKTLHLVEQAEDTIFLKSLGRGQWNIIAKGSQLHCGDHNSGSVGGANGAYGGIWGVSSRIVPYGGGIDGCSAWFIREMPKLPLTVDVADANFKSEFVHFDPANTITLTADKSCAFEGLVLCDLLGNVIEVESVEAVGDKMVVISVANNIVGCSFAFTNESGVTSVTLDAGIPVLQFLQEAYDKAVAVAPVEGTEVMQYADLTAYNAAIAKAEAMLESGSESEDAVNAVIAELDAAVKALKPNMPVAGKYYYIYNSVTAFEDNYGLRMALYSDGTNLRWGFENDIQWTRYWQFEQATADELKAAGMKEDACAFFIKSLATNKYIGEVTVTDGNSNSLTSKSSALPVVLTSFGGVGGVEVALDILGQSGKRIHANGHGGGSGKGGNIVYWNSGVGTASSWTIVETQYDATDIDFTEIEPETAVVKGTYDLFGRRVVAPTAPGIYIIDGKKKYIKK